MASRRDSSQKTPLSSAWSVPEYLNPVSTHQIDYFPVVFEAKESKEPAKSLFCTQNNVRDLFSKCVYAKIVNHPACFCSPNL